MLNPKVKALLKKTKIGHKLHSWMRRLYLQYLFSRRCRRLRRFGPGILRAIHDEMRRMGWIYYADFGTLLGVVRDHGFIPHDDDIDLVVPEIVDPVRLYEAMSGLHGFRFLHAFTYEGRITELTFSCCGISIDFFYLFEEGGRSKYFAYYEPKSPYVMFRDPWIAYSQLRTRFGAPKEFSVNGMTINIPENYDILLKEKYGNWRVPIKAWKGQTEEGQNPYEFYGEKGIMLSKEMFEMMFLNKGVH